MTAFPEIGDVFGRYEINGVLGRGGMGVVFSATQLELGRRVALKVLAPQLAADTRFRNRFSREAGALSLMDSPHIVHIYEHGEHDGCLFIATQLVTGGDLRQLLEREQGLEPVKALQVVADVAAALVDAHGAGVIHRDIKPANVLIRRSANGEMFAYLCDFGIATTDRDETTLSGGIPGSIGYLAPERQQGASATVASDIYSLGCLLWATLTAKPPYQGSDVDVALAHLRAPLPALPEDEPMSQQVNAILRHSMAKRPEERYAAASDFRADVLAAQAQAAAVAPGGLAAGRRRTSRILSPVTAVLGFALVAALATIAALLMRDSESPDRTAGPQSSPTVTGTPEPLICWDKKRVLDPRLCTTPENVEGLRWVFPTLNKNIKQCIENPDPVAPGKLRAWFCPFADVRREGVRYNEWESARAARRATERDFALATTATVRLEDGSALLLWNRPSEDEFGLVATAILYQDWPFSIDVQSTSRPGVEVGCLFVELRSANTFKPVSIACPLHQD